MPTSDKATGAAGATIWGYCGARLQGQAVGKCRGTFRSRYGATPMPGHRPDSPGVYVQHITATPTVRSPVRDKGRRKGIMGTPERTRTSGLLLRRQALYPLSYGRRQRAGIVPELVRCCGANHRHQQITADLSVTSGAQSGYHWRVSRAITCACRRFWRVGGLMSSQDVGTEAGRVRLNDEDVAYLMNLLRNASQPVATQQLIDALRRQSSQFHPLSSADKEGAS
jgi:hypothetical protein